MLLRSLFAPTLFPVVLLVLGGAGCPKAAAPADASVVEAPPPLDANGLLQQQDAALQGCVARARVHEAALAGVLHVDVSLGSDGGGAVVVGDIRMDGTTTALKSGTAADALKSCASGVVLATLTGKRLGNVDGSRATVDVVVAGPARPAVPPLSPEALRQAVERAWRGVGTTAATVACPDQFEYKPGGLTVNYCRAAGVFGYAALQAALDMPIFLSGPHTRDNLVTSSERTFGHYNPAFVRWLVDNGVPGASDSSVRAATQGLYDEHLATAARAFWYARGLLNHDPGRAASMRAARDRFAKGQGDDPRYTYWELFAEDGGYEAQAIAGSGLSFWLRRDIDGTAATFEEGLRKVLATYDAAFLRDFDATPFDRFPFARVAGVDSADDNDGDTDGSGGGEDVPEGLAPPAPADKVDTVTD